ncbi:hypothetical protein OWA11_05120, partial [Acidithiobacillus ferriphilus]|nr:hypothetical protein [Acidithiobacillus ferriphilus]
MACSACVTLWNSIPFRPLTNLNQGVRVSQSLATIIDAAWENRAEISPKQAPAELREAVHQTIEGLDKGVLRVA